MKLAVLRLGFLLLGLWLSACASVSAPPEAAVLPAPPHYQATAVPTATPRPTLTPRPTPTSIAPTASANSSFAITDSASPSITPIVLRQPVHDLAALNEYQRGIAYIAVTRDEYQSAASQRSLDELFSTGANYISILVTWYQTDDQATVIEPTADTPSDDDLTFVINYAHAHGVKVLLKPQINFTNDPDHWRGEIQFDNQIDWENWFTSYRTFIMHYAEFAQRSGVEEFSVGTELFATTKRTADWRAIIQDVRQVYTGLLTYSANHSGEEVQVQFWDALDFIGVNVFYHLTNYRTPTLAQVLKGWELPTRQLTNLHNNFPNQPIIFTEVGYPSMDLASVWPWNWQRSAALDIDEQTVLYEALFQTWWHNDDHPWFRGMFIWNWTANPDQGGMTDHDYTPHNKPAETILRSYYQRDDTALTP